MNLVVTFTIYVTRLNAVSRLVGVRLQGSKVAIFYLRALEIGRTSYLVNYSPVRENPLQEEMWLMPKALNMKRKHYQR